MRQCRQLCKFIFVLFFCAFDAFADSFLEGTEDVPLMNGMQYSADETFSIDNEDGRLYFSKLFIDAKNSDILTFYRQTLPQLGWQETQDFTFEREDEILRIAVVDSEYHSNKKTTVIFELITKSK
ncbi:MAG: hypothetical protein E7013_01615 [Alphaproteobacteria bacterium]|nr:hypothetical protein [Alphaproteobacteria bacterium]